MPALRLPETRIDLRQGLAAGRFSEAITERPIEGFTATLDYAHAGGGGTFAAVLAIKPGGWFTLHLHPDRDMPDLSGAGTVTLTLRFSREGQPDVTVAQDVPGAELALVETTLTVAGQEVTAHRIAAAPFAFAAEVQPRAVLLDGLVLFDDDPETPAAGVTITAAPAAPVAADGEGRFRIPALPVAESVTLAFDDGGDVTERTLRPDYARPAMTVTFSIPSP